MPRASVSAMPKSPEWRATWTSRPTNIRLHWWCSLLDMLFLKFPASEKTQIPALCDLNAHHMSSLVLTRTRPSIFLPTIMIIWGALTCVMGAIQDYKHLVALRVIIGCIESGFAPGVLLVLSSWYKRTEQSRRFGVYISAAILSGAFGGLLAAVIVKNLEGVHGIRGWRWLFIVEGAATIGVALIALFVLPDFPANSRRLSEREKDIAVARLAAEDVTALTEGSQRLTHWQAVVRSIQDWRTWIFVVGYMVSVHCIHSLAAIITRITIGHRGI